MIEDSSTKTFTKNQSFNWAENQIIDDFENQDLDD